MSFLHVILAIYTLSDSDQQSQWPCQIDLNLSLYPTLARLSGGHGIFFKWCQEKDRPYNKVFLMLFSDTVLKYASFISFVWNFWHLFQSKITCSDLQLNISRWFIKTMHQNHSSLWQNNFASNLKNVLAKLIYIDILKTTSKQLLDDVSNNLLTFKTPLKSIYQHILQIKHVK